MRRALLVLIPQGHEARTLLDRFLEFEERWTEEDIRPLRQDVWNVLVGLEQEGQLYITSFRPGASLPEKIAGGLLPSSRQEFQHEMLETSSGTFSGVMVWPTMAQPEPQTEMPVESDGNRKKSSTLLQETKAAFQQEVVRFALSPDGFATHTQLIEHMFA